MRIPTSATFVNCHRHHRHM